MFYSTVLGQLKECTFKRTNSNLSDKILIQECDHNIKFSSYVNVGYESNTKYYWHYYVT